MLASLFLKAVNLAINASWLILAVIIVRLLIKKAPKWISCLLWGLVALRLVCPVSLESALSLLPSTEVIPENIRMAENPQIDSGIRIIDNAVNPVMESTLAPKIGDGVNHMQIITSALSVIWIIGFAAMLLYAVVSYILLRGKVSARIAVEYGIYESDEVRSPFILGIIRPMIYVPSGIAEDTLELVIAHEKAHLKRYDHLWKPFGFLLLSVYWFNPLCWVAYILFCRDIEAACDEKVIRDKDKDYIAAYSQALLDCSKERRTIAACPLAFGETGVKERVKGVLNYKKPAFLVIIAAVIACTFVAVCFMTNPTNRRIDPELRAFLETQVLDDNYSAFEDLGYEVFAVCDIEVLGRKGRDEIVVYAMVLDQVFSYQNGELKEESGGHIPTVFTVKKSEDGYKLDEYWIPGDGSYYEPDIKSKFPVNLWSAAFDNTRYIEKQQERNRKKALEHFEQEDISAYRTDYIGDATKVTQIAMRLPYPGDYDTYDVSAEFDVSDVPGESVRDWMSITLPNGYSLSNFYDNIGYMGGSLILPRVYDDDNSESIPIEWRYSGLISRMPAENTDITFQDGIPYNMGVPVDNHTTQEYISAIGLERSNNQWPALMLKENHDLYTHAQIEEMKQNGINIDDMELTHDYWCFWFVKEDEDTYYVLKLSAKEFTEKEATDIALGVVIK